MLYANIKARKEYTSKHSKDEYRSLNKYWVWMLPYLAFIIYSIIMMATMDPNMEQAMWFRLAYPVLSLILFGQMLVTIIKRRILLGNDGFVYEENYVSWRSVLNMEAKKKGIQRIVEVLGANNRKYIMPADIGKEVHESYEAWRRAKKEKKGKK